MTHIFTNEDCMDVMARYPDKHFQLAIVDPPYGIRQMDADNKSRGKYAIAKNYKKLDDSKSPDKKYFNELLRVSINRIIFGANHFISKIPYDSSCWIVWDKDNGLTDFSDCELAYTSFRTAVRKFKYKWQGMLQENMKCKEYRIHPTQKPIALYKWLLQNYAKQGDLILDTHVGSASSLIAFEDCGFEYVACEKDADYYKAAVQRIKDFRAQGKLPLDN